MSARTILNPPLINELNGLFSGGTGVGTIYASTVFIESGENAFVPLTAGAYNTLSVGGQSNGILGCGQVNIGDVELTSTDTTLQSNATELYLGYETATPCPLSLGYGTLLIGGGGVGNGTLGCGKVNIGNVNLTSSATTLQSSATELYLGYGTATPCPLSIGYGTLLIGGGGVGNGTLVCNGITLGGGALTASNGVLYWNAVPIAG
jgi:hypothetical protein